MRTDLPICRLTHRFWTYTHATRSTVPRNRKGTLLVTDEESSPGVPGDSRVMVAKGKQKAALVKPRRPAAPGGRPVRLTRDQQARKSIEEAEANKPLMNRGLVDALMRAGIEEVRLVVEPDEPGEKSESRVCSLDEAVEVARDEMDVDLVLVTPKEVGINTLFFVYRGPKH